MRYTPRGRGTRRSECHDDDIYRDLPAWLKTLSRYLEPYAADESYGAARGVGRRQEYCRRDNGYGAHSSG
jgi:hypothetical protein